MLIAKGSSSHSLLDLSAAAEILLKLKHHILVLYIKCIE